MKKIDLSVYGITDVKEIFHNLSYDELFRHETDPSLKGYEKGMVTSLGAVAVDTGCFTGRSPKDKYIVREETSEGNIWWKNEKRKASDNKPVSVEVWNDLKKTSTSQLSGKKLYVQDGYAGANPETRLKVRFIMEVAWQAHFVKNMFISPTAEELENFEPDFVVLNASKTQNDKWKEHGTEQRCVCRFQSEGKNGLHRRDLVRWGNEEGDLFGDELLPSPARNRRHALLGQHGQRRRYGHFLRTFRDRQDHALGRSFTGADR